MNVMPPPVIIDHLLDIDLHLKQYGVEVKPNPRPEGFDKPFSKFKEMCEFFKAIGYVKGDPIRIKIDYNSKRFVMLTMPSPKSIENNCFGKAFRRELENLYELSKLGHHILIQHNKPYRYIEPEQGRRNSFDSDASEHIEWINHIVLESDTLPIEKQRELLPILKPFLTVAVSTGPARNQLMQHLLYEKVTR